MKINDSINPEEAVANGAAIFAAKLIGLNNDIIENVVLTDITPFSLGMATKNKRRNSELIDGNRMSIVIPKGTKIPTKITKEYKTSDDFQKIAAINVYEGDSKFVRNNQFLGSFELVGLPKKKKNEVIVEITFSLDKNSKRNNWKN